jgi:hypothetical protein
MEQHIIICLKDQTPENPATYVQATRRRFSLKDAKERIKSIAPSRLPIIVPVPFVKLDENNYPILT